jgi:hypothetical protein
VALLTYSDIKSSVSDWLVRDDLTDRSADFIALAESRLNRELRVREMISQATGTISTQTIQIPGDFVEVLRLTLDTSADMPLEYRPVEDSEIRVAGSTSGQPSWFSVIGSNLKLYPIPDGSYDYTLDYYATIPALSDTNTTNWLLEKAPDIYLFGALSEAAPFLMDDARVPFWESRFQAAKRSLNSAEIRAKRTSGPRRMRVLS